MSTSQSREQEGGNYVTNQYCNASQEALLGSEKMNLDILDDCPACWKSHGVKCLVADHRSNESTGN